MEESYERRSFNIESQYELELEKVVETIKKEGAKHVCLQFPRGLAPKVIEIAKLIENQTQAKCHIWIGPTYGACDLPRGLDNINPKVDLLIHFGHAKWKYKGDVAGSSSEVSVHEV